ncbi:unnamed protein product [Rotaria socialis]|uniref:Uncharacterized protein n=1 Tax=Rotaria socialis TaxID=392032 RepID=A0A821C1N1_9BILA|nr:unnamed protein product [Rotaria socialis]
MNSLIKYIHLHYYFILLEYFSIDLVKNEIREDLTPLTIDTTTPKEPEKLGVASCITPDLDKLFNLYTKILDPEESDRDGLS